MPVRATIPIVILSPCFNGGICRKQTDDENTEHVVEDRSCAFLEQDSVWNDGRRDFTSMKLFVTIFSSQPECKIQQRGRFNEVEN